MRNRNRNRNRFRNRIKELLETKKRVGRMNGDKPGSGPGGKCVCSKCNYEEKHVRGEPCNKKKCPECGAKMTKK